MPKLAEHLSRVHCDITIVATDWFLCLFCTSLPAEVTILRAVPCYGIRKWCDAVQANLYKHD